MQTVSDIIFPLYSDIQVVIVFQNKMIFILYNYFTTRIKCSYVIIYPFHQLLQYTILRNIMFEQN